MRKHTEKPFFFYSHRVPLKDFIRHVSDCFCACDLRDLKKLERNSTVTSRPVSSI
jgi:hypothetical protein